MSLLQNRLNVVNNEIKVYLDEIAKLQARVTQLQSHAQEVQGAEQAAESALAQIDTAIAMLQAICPDEIGIFKAAIDAKFNAPLPQIQGGTDVDDVIDSEDTTPPAPDAEGIVETTFSVVVDDSDDSIIEQSDSEEVQDNNDDQPQETSNLVDVEVLEDDSSGDDNGNGNGHTNGHHLLTYRDLQIVDRPTLIKLANLHNVPGYKSKKRDELASLLDGLVSSSELTVAKNGKH